MSSEVSITLNKREDGFPFEIRKDLLLRFRKAFPEIPMKKAMFHISDWIGGVEISKKFLWFAYNNTEYFTVTEMYNQTYNEHERVRTEFLINLEQAVLNEDKDAALELCVQLNSNKNLLQPYPCG